MDSLSQKLKEKLNASKMKRSNTTYKKKILEKNKVPADMMDQYVKALNHQTSPNISQLMNQIKSNPSRMAPPNMEHLVDDMKDSPVMGQLANQLKHNPALKKMANELQNSNGNFEDMFKKLKDSPQFEQLTNELKSNPAVEKIAAEMKE